MARRKQEEPAYNGPCAFPGCAETGAHRAPKSRERLQEYQWLCLDHVREFNQSWDYFKGMDADEIEAFRSDAVTGHRPTWEREDHLRRAPRVNWHQRLDEGLRRFFNWDEETLRKNSFSALPARERKALTALQLNSRVPPAELKKHYRTLVKQYHPDLNRGEREYEEKFKLITTSYRYLLKLYEE